LIIQTSNKRFFKNENYSMAIQKHKVSLISYRKFSMEIVGTVINNPGLTGHTCPASANPQNI
jgi:hypothetical protein